MKKIIISMLAVLPMLFGASAYTAFGEEITVYMTIEKLTLGQGYIMTPTAITADEGTSVAQILEMTMPQQYMHTGTIEDNLYVSAFNDIEEEINSPEYIMELIGETTARQDSEWLSEFDYSDSSGWKFSVNNEFPSVSSSDYILNDGDVIRWQFSLYGYGTDLEEYAYTDKSELIKAVANGSYSEYAIDVLTRLDCDGDEVNDAYTELEGGVVVEDSGYAGANLNLTADYIKTSVTEPQIAQVGGEWSVIGLARSGAEVDAAYFDGYYAKVVDTLRKNNGVLHTRKYTEYARVALALSAIGKNPANAGGYNLITPLTDFDAVMKQGTNGAVFALMAIDSCDYETPVRQKYIDEILSRQLDCGAFSLSKGGEADVDITAMALCALGNYTDATVKNSVERAVAYLSEIQESDGGYSVGGEKTSESAVQVIVALTSVGISPDDERFVKNGSSVLDNLLSYARENGGFSHTAESDVNLMATEQALYALAAVERYSRGMDGLYNMSGIDVTGPVREVSGYEKIRQNVFEIAEILHD